MPPTKNITAANGASVCEIALWLQASFCAATDQLYAWRASCQNRRRACLLRPKLGDRIIPLAIGAKETFLQSMWCQK